MKKSLIYISCLTASLLALAPSINAQVGFVQWWDNNGTSPAGDGTWDTTSLNWTTSATLTSSTTVFTNGNFALFAAGSGTTTTNTITVATAVTAAGVGNATTNGTIIGAGFNNLAFSGPGSINLPTGPWSFECGATGNTMYFNVPITGPGGIVQHNSGAMELLGTNTYSGGTTVTGGQILWYNNSASFGTGPIINTGASSLEIAAGVSGTITLTNAISLSTASVLNFASGNTTCTGPVTLGATTMLKNNGASTTTLTMSGPISGAFGINYQCPNVGKLVLSGPNTYTGQTIIGVAGTGTIVSVSNINSVTSPTQLASSSLGKPSSAANGTIAIGSTTTPATLVYTGPGETSDRVINLAGTTGGATIEMDGTGPLVLTLPFTATGAGAKTLTLQGTSTTTNTIKGAIVDSTGKTALTKAQTGNWVLTGTNTYTGNMTISGGALTIAGAGNLGSGNYAGTIADTASLVYSSSGTQTLGGVISGTAGTVTVNGTGKLILTATDTYTGLTTVNGSGSTLELGDGATKSGTVAGGISVSNSANLLLAPGGATITYNATAQVISGSGAVTMNGPGTFIIGGNHNTYTGATIISGGILQTGGDSGPGVAANFGTTPSSFQAANITLNGGTLQGNNPNFAFNPNRGITLTANSGLSATANGNQLYPIQGELGIQGPITDNSAGFGVTITGQTNATTGAVSGVYLEGTNTYTGPTVVATGILSLYLNGSISSSSSININAGAVFDVSSNSATTWNLSQPLNANGTGLGLPGFLTTAPTPAAIFVGANAGTVNFGSQNLGLSITPTNFTGDGNQPALYVSQGTVALNGNSVSVINNGTSPLGYGVYTLIQQASGSMSVGTAPTLAGGIVGGNGIIGTAIASLRVNGGALNLIVAPSSGLDPNSPYFSGLTPAPGFIYGSSANVNLSGTVSNLSSGIATAGDTINVQIGTFGFQTATIGANGSFSINYSLPAFTAAGSYPITYAYGGALGSATDTSTALQIGQALLTITPSDPSRNWNGSTAATVVFTPSTLNGDSVTVVSSGTSTFATANPGLNIPVTVTSLRITGAAAGNYYLASTSFSLPGNILTPAFTWNGLDSVTNANFQWGDQFNWVGNVAPDPIGDALDFAGTTGLVPVVQAPYTNWSLTFDSTAGAFSITNLGSGGASLAIGPGGITNNSTSAQTFGLPVNTLTTTSSQWYVTNGGSLLIISNVTDAGGGITLAGAGTLNLSGSNNAITGPLTNLAGTILFTGGTKLNNASYAGAISNNGTVNYNSTSNQTLSGIISGSGTMILGGTGTLTVSGANTYTGQTIVSNGSLVITKDSNLGTPPASPVANQLVLNNFINGGANNYGLRVQTTSFALDANRGIFLGPNGGSINVQNAITLTVPGVISGPGAFYASPNSSAGFGNIVLTANNTYQGGTFIGAGVLQLGVNGALPTGTPLTVNESAGTVAATLDMNGFSQTIGPLQSGAFGGANLFLPTIKLTGALTILQTNTTTTFGGAMIGSGGNVTIATAVGGVPGTLILTGTNTYTGNTFITAGTLALSTLSSISNSAQIYIGAGGTFDVSALTSSTYNLGANNSLGAAGTGTGLGTTAAVINGAASGTVNLGSQPITLTFTPTAFTGDTAHPALYVSQGTLQLSGNTITVNNVGAQPIGAGTYTLIQQASGSISGTPNATVSVIGNGLATGATASVSVSGGVVNLVVSGTTPSPTINSFVRSGGNLILGGTNGPANGTYTVLSSTNAALHLNLWTPVSTNTFSPTGTFSVTNAIAGSRQFFVIQVP